MDENEIKQEAGKVIDKLKALIKEGNVTRVRLKRNGETLISLPVNVGVVGALIGIHAAPFAVIGAALVAYGLNCQIEVEKKDGSVEQVKEAPAAEEVFEEAEAPEEAEAEEEEPAEEPEEEPEE